MVGEVGGRRQDAGGSLEEPVVDVFIEVVGVDDVEEFLSAGGEVAEVEGTHVGEGGVGGSGGGRGSWQHPHPPGPLSHAWERGR